MAQDIPRVRQDQIVMIFSWYSTTLYNVRMCPPGELINIRDGPNFRLLEVMATSTHLYSPFGLIAVGHRLGTEQPCLAS